MSQNHLIDKLLIMGKLKILTGLHIGGNSDFSPIGSVDSPFVRDSLTHEPIIPGSSIKGKMRTLLVKNTCSDYILNDIDADTDIVKRLFGSSGKNSARFARLQFFDLFLNRDCVEQFKDIETDTYLGEIKFENTISRLTGIATLRSCPFVLTRSGRKWDDNDTPQNADRNKSRRRNVLSGRQQQGVWRRKSACRKARPQSDSKSTALARPQGC